MTDVFAELARHSPEQRMRMGLADVRAALDERGAPDAGLPALIVGGTNGKGSTCRFVEARARRRRLRTVTYASPHLVHPAERLRIDGAAVDRNRFAGSVAEVWRRHPHLTYFEILTVAALVIAAEERPDVAILEVGLGGRLDAVNAVADVRGTAITSVGLDHTEVLGPTVAHIAWEKAGILRPGVPCVIGALPPEAEAVVRQRAVAVGAPLHAADRPQFDDWDGPAWLPANLGVAAALGRIAMGWDEPAVAAELSARPPGRWTVLPGSPWRLVDGAHNPEGAAALAAALAGRGPVDLWLQAGAGKDLTGLVAPLRPLARRWFVVDDPDPAWHAADVVVAALGPRAEATVVAAADAPAAFAGSATAAVWYGSLRALAALAPWLPADS